MTLKTIFLAAALAGLAGCAAERPKNTAARPEPPAKMEAPEGVVYCGGGAVKRQIEYAILPRPDGKWNARVVVNGRARRAMTSYSYFGKRTPPKGFVVALLGEDRSEFLVFRDGRRRWMEYGDYTYRQCN